MLDREDRSVTRVSQPHEKEKTMAKRFCMYGVTISTSLRILLFSFPFPFSFIFFSSPGTSSQKHYTPLYVEVWNDRAINHNDWH